MTVQGAGVFSVLVNAVLLQFCSLCHVCMCNFSTIWGWRLESSSWSTRAISFQVSIYRFV